MSDLFKFSYVRGAQNALVNSGAIGEYPSALAANTAVKIASYRLTEDPLTEQVNNEKLAEAMADIIQLGNGDLTSIIKRAMAEGGVPPEVVSAVMEDAAAEAHAADAAAAAGEVTPVAAESMKEEVQKAVQELAVVSRQTSDAAMDLASKMGSTQQAAAAAVARLRKSAADSVEGPGAANALNSVENAEHDGRDENAYVGLPEATFVAPPGHGEVKDVSGGEVSLDPKTAAAILRKLAEGENAAALNSVEDAEKEDGERANPDYAQGLPEATFVAPPGHGEAKSASAAYNTLLAKTAQQVIGYLPEELAETDKLAAIRAMMGMTLEEKSAYIGRITEAVKEAMGPVKDPKYALKEEGKDKEDKKEDDDKEEDVANKGLKALMEANEDKMKEEDEEEEKAASILRALGVGR